MDLDFFSRYKVGGGTHPGHTRYKVGGWGHPSELLVSEKSERWGGDPDALEFCLKKYLKFERKSMVFVEKCLAIAILKRKMAFVVNSRPIMPAFLFE